MIDIDPETFAGMTAERQDEVIKRMGDAHYDLGVKLGEMHYLRALCMARLAYPEAASLVVVIDLKDDGYDVSIFQVLDADGQALYHLWYSTPDEDSKILPIEEELDDAATLGYEFGDTRGSIYLSLT